MWKAPALIDYAASLKCDTLFISDLVAFESLEDAALRAVRSCQPFKLPPESYDGWKDIEWVFDPRQMM